ncbi:DUF1566 domain-containing protein [Stenotrophomonas sp. 278]|uniref:Lcl C-terminal domain-containing protein n=1 Tax=Stenotrophomonas sp. 278 TaxID=2479851 RepID=UPI000F663DE7|nr:DUF1566 domain-containing protein [Stenotrophomonas sp. 278]RRU17858.1 DUF1566 domain-containing protein [Stenotrophomonas sp. 278]
MNAVTIHTGGASITIDGSSISVQQVERPLPNRELGIDQLSRTVGQVAVTHTKLFADGTTANNSGRNFSRTEHVAIIDHATGLMWAVESIGDEDGDPMNHAACVKAAGELRLLGHDDWRLPTRSELAALVDDTRTDPAIDTSLFPRVKPHWHWTSTDYAGGASYAWGVHFDHGHFGSYHRAYDGFVLAVRRASQ